MSGSFQLERITVRRRPGFKTQGIMLIDNQVIPCALGRSGIGVKRGEGDGITPLGQFGLLNAMVRTDRVPLREFNVPWREIKPDDGWCDAVGDANYNCPVPLPYPASHERLFRKDHLYDIVFVMDHNVTRRLGVGGSAIFFHLSHDDYRPTEGCVAISRADMLRLVPHIGPNTVMVVE